MANFVRFVRPATVKSRLPAKALRSMVKSRRCIQCDGKFLRINDVCGHRGGPLGEGELERHHGICPCMAGAIMLPAARRAFVPISDGKIRSQS